MVRSESGWASGGNDRSRFAPVILSLRLATEYGSQAVTRLGVQLAEVGQAVRLRRLD
jgi:hypothetical protein